MAALAAGSLIAYAIIGAANVLQFFCMFLIWYLIFRLLFFTFGRLAPCDARSIGAHMPDEGDEHRDG